MISKELHLSPSYCHYHLMDTIEQELSYKNGGFGSFAAWQSRLRHKLADITGLSQIVPANAFDVQSVWRQEDSVGTIEKIVYASEPYSDVPAYVCIPRGATPPYRYFICVQGHSTGMHNSIRRNLEDEFTPHMPEGDRDFAYGCMERGIAALCIEQRSFGYRGEVNQMRRAQSYCHDAAMHALMLGRTLIGERVFDVGRGIEYLKSRGDAQMESIGIVGNSGGGTTSVFAAALLPEIAYAIPSCYFCTFRDSILSIYHCVCNYVPGLYRYAEMADVLGLFAPKGLVVVSGAQDDIFPLEATKRAFADLKDIYRAAGAEDNCTLVVGSEGHRFYAEEAWKAMSVYLQR